MFANSSHLTFYQFEDDNERIEKYPIEARKTSPIPHIVTKMKPVIQFDKQFIIVIFLMTLLCTQRIFGYDLSLLTVRGIFALNTQFNSATFFSHALSNFLFFFCHMNGEICWCAHFISYNSFRRAQWRGNSIYFFLFVLIWCAFHRNISPYFLHAHDDTTKMCPGPEMICLWKKVRIPVCWNRDDLNRFI